MDGEIVSNITFPLAKCLVTFDLSANNVTGMHELPVQRLMLLRENHQLNVDVKVLTQALSKHKFLDLSGTALSNQDEAAELLKEGVIKTTDMHTFRDETGGLCLQRCDRHPEGDTKQVLATGALQVLTWMVQKRSNMRDVSIQPVQ